MDVPLQFVVGKGGVGKSTLTAALALEAAGRGLETLVVEIGDRGGLSRLFGVDGSDGSQARRVAPSLTLLSLSGEDALAEYLRMVVPIRRLLDAVFATRLYAVFVAGAPGLRELMTIGKIWYEADRRGSRGRPAWDRVFVDAGASGHSLQYLQMPSAAAAAFRSGLVHREALRVQAMLADPGRCLVHVVATAEEMPATEACQIVERLRGGLRLPVGRLFVNRCRALAPEGVGAALRLLERVPLAAADEPLRPFAREAAGAALAWQDVQETAIARLEDETGLAAERLPLLVREEFGLEEARVLAAMVGPDRGARR